MYTAEHTTHLENGVGHLEHMLPQANDKNLGTVLTALCVVPGELSISVLSAV